MTKKDLRVGYVCEIMEEGKGTSLVMVLPSTTNASCVSGSEVWFPLHELGDDLVYGEYSVTKVYGLSTNMNAHKLSTKDRELLWERPKYYNGKVVCIESTLRGLTVGKIYKFVDGVGTSDYGSDITVDEVKDFEDLKGRFHRAKFIEVVE